MKVTHYLLDPGHLPVDFKADPDGTSDYDALVAASGFDPNLSPPPAIGALTEPWFGHPEGSAVVVCAHRSLFAIVETTGAASLHRAA